MFSEFLMFDLSSLSLGGMYLPVHISQKSPDWHLVNKLTKTVLAPSHIPQLGWLRRSPCVPAVEAGLSETPG